MRNLLSAGITAEIPRPVPGRPGVNHYAVFVIVYLVKIIAIYREDVKYMANSGAIFKNTINTGWFSMQIKKLFRFSVDVEAVIDVEEVKENDYGVNKYFKQFLNQLVNEPEALEKFLLINFLDYYVNFYESGFSGLVDMIGNEQAYILSAAEKCETEVRCYFNDLFKTGLKQDDYPDIKEGESEIQLNPIERDLIMTQLISRLTGLIPIQFQWYELPLESIGQEKARAK
jgi:hypothetical protein